MARVGIAAGTATAVSNRVSRRQYNRWADQDTQQYEQQQQQEPAPAPPPATSGEDSITQLQKLGDLHSQGILTDEEFAAQKAKILNQ